MERIKSNVLEEALALSNEIIANIELSNMSLTSIAFKISRLARILNDFEMFEIMQNEISGYKTTPKGIEPNVWNQMKIAGRIYQEEKEDGIKDYGYTESIESIEQNIESMKLSLSQSADPNVSVSSANPNQYVFPTFGNKNERNSLRHQILRETKRLSERKSFMYKYALERNCELKYKQINNDIFTRLQNDVDGKIGNYVPDIVLKFNAVYENLNSDNPEDLSNAVHSCRRILQSLADVLYPPTDPIEISIKGKKKTVELGPENYINRLIQFIESKSNSKNYKSIVGSQLDYIGERLDSVYNSTNKGTHETITEKKEADRYVIYTYMLLSDILSLID